MAITNESLLAALQEKFSAAILASEEPHGLLTITATKEEVLNMLKFLKEDPTFQFGFLTDICGVHYPSQENALGVVYHLHSLVNNKRIRFKAFIPESNPHIGTATDLFLAANWMERETYDFYGIIFDGHPDLRRILNMDDMTAFPMRKEYPLEDPNRKDKNDEFFGR